MNKTRTLATGLCALAASLLAGCPANPPTPGLTCTPTPGQQPFKITYGVKSDNKTVFEVKERVSVKRGYGLEFQLVPKNHGGADFNSNVVTLKGKSGAANAWFTQISGSFDNTAPGHTIGICATGVPLGTYEYEIHIEGFGYLDPRLDVIP